jgi:pimeloyl-ACP methyl ester carboxylesterase
MGDSQLFSKFTPEDVADDIRTVIDHLKLDSGVIVVSNSLSTGSAMILAAEGHPSVKGVVMLSPIVRDLPGDKYFRPISHCLFTWPWGAPLWKSYYTSLYKRKVRPEGFDDHVQNITASITKANSLWSIGKFARASKTNVEAHLRRVQVPALAVFGDSDPDYPNAAGEEAWLKTVVTSGRLQSVLLKNVGHYPHVEAAEETNAAIREFISSL